MLKLINWSRLKTHWEKKTLKTREEERENGIHSDDDDDNDDKKISLFRYTAFDSLKSQIKELDRDITFSIV